MYALGQFYILYKHVDFTQKTQSTNQQKSYYWTIVFPLTNFV